MPIHNPTLKHFILRQRAISLYRSAVRASVAIPDPVTRKETVAWIRAEFERNKHLADVALIENSLNVIKREIKSILPTFTNKS